MLAVAAALAPTPLTGQATAAGTPFPRYGAAMTYDAATGKAVLFGGADRQFSFSDTWTWNGTAWKRHLPPVSPSPRARASMAYDPTTGTVVLFGGEGTDALGDPQVLNDTWIWDGAQRTWTEATPLLSPPPRGSASLAFDPPISKVVLFGGTDHILVHGDTWTWDGTARTWARENPATSPPDRSSSAMAYHKPTRRLVLFGGQGTRGANRTDTWTWNGATKTWAQQAPPVSPQPRTGSQMVYDAARKTTVLFGGAIENSSNNLSSETWTWDGATWAKKAPLASPPARAEFAMAYHPPTQKVVLFGGLGANFEIFFNDTWTWNGTNWKRPA